MPTTQPQLGYGGTTEATRDQVNIWMRGQPWYQQMLKAWGQDGANGVHLQDWQKEAIVKAAQANGVVVDQGKQEIDDSGNFRNVGHKLRNTLIVAGIAGATIATMGAAGVFAGAAGAGAGAAGTAGTVAGVEGGAYGLGAGAVGALGTGAMGAAAIPALGVAGGAAAAGGTLGSTVGMGGFDAAGNFIGDTTISNVAGGGGFASGAGHFLASQGGQAALSTAGNVFSNIYSANKQASANADAARLADEASKRAEQFAREQAEGAYQSSEHTQHANYDQWRARQDAIMGSLGHQLGIAYTAPDYVPGIDPRYTGGATAPTSARSAAGDPAQAFIANWQRTHDPKEGIAPLAQAYKAAGFGDRFLVNGTTPSNNELVVGGQKFKVLSGENGATPSWYVPGTNDGGAPVARPSLATTFVRPNFVPQQTPYRPGTLGAYVGS